MGCEGRHKRHAKAYPVGLAEEGLPFALLGSRWPGLFVLKGAESTGPEITQLKKGCVERVSDILSVEDILRSIRLHSGDGMREKYDNLL